MRLSSNVDNAIMSSNEDMSEVPVTAETAITDWARLGNAVRSARRRHGMTQQDLAGRASVSRSWLAKLESGHRGAELEQILRVLSALGLTMTLQDQSASTAGDDGAADARGHTSRADRARKAQASLLAERAEAATRRRQAWANAQ